MDLFSGQEMFERIDKEEDGEVYLREVVDFLAVLDNNIEQSHQVFKWLTWAFWTEDIVIHYLSDDTNTSVLVKDLYCKRRLGENAEILKCLF